MSHFDRVKEFHCRFGFPIAEGLAEEHPTRSQALKQISHHLEVAQHVAAAAMTDGGSTSLSRLRLLIEELRELTDAMYDGDYVQVADAVGDLTYLLYGTAVAYDLPLDDLVIEIHRSNMTKEPGAFKPVKGPSYSPPRIVAILERSES